MLFRMPLKMAEPSGPGQRRHGIHRDIPTLRLNDEDLGPRPVPLIEMVFDILGHG